MSLNDEIVAVHALCTMANLNVSLREIAGSCDSVHQSVCQKKKQVDMRTEIDAFFSFIHEKAHGQFIDEFGVNGQDLTAEHFSKFGHGQQHKLNRFYNKYNIDARFQNVIKYIRRKRSNVIASRIKRAKYSTRIKTIDEKILHKNVDEA